LTKERQLFAVSYCRWKVGVELIGVVSGPARFWGGAKAFSEGWMKYLIQPDVKSTSHQDKSTPGQGSRKGDMCGDHAGAGLNGRQAGHECRAA